ncbi:MAG: O-succinylhomoserine sulfhydrylase [Alphaproteobacteria bacterium]|nr:O-succinylhomoserine sulfhydrylase [Alphaproteobacteria bacterium]MBL6776379.1 O-succinylhomoserine sulfhydrylase [Alphaproteobacteria bacterium]
MASSKDWHSDTKQVRAGLARTENRETSEALFLNSGYVYDSAEQAAAAFKGEVDNFIYSRYGNPTLQMAEERLATIEGAEACRVCSTGMAAIFASMACQLEAGDRVVASQALFGACHAILTKILPRWGIQTELIDGTDITAWQAALAKPAKLVFMESPSNPVLQLVDIAAVSALAHKAGAKVIVDNVFATPIHQSPLKLGADIVTYSTTKHLDGQGRLLGGAVLADKAFIEEVFQPFYRQTGASMSAFNAWVLVKSLKTLRLRIEAMSATAARIAEKLAEHKAIEAVLYPGHKTHPQHKLAKAQMSGFGSLIALKVKGGRAAAFTVLDSLNLIDISNNLGDAKSLACHPASTTHANLSDSERLALSISESHLRLSVGLEHYDDLWRDLCQALDKIVSD